MKDTFSFLVSLRLAYIILQLACLGLALDDGNGNTIQLKSLQSAFYPWSAVFILPPVCSPQPAFYTDH